LNVTVQPQLNGKDKVTATTLGGTVVFGHEYGLFSECRLFEFRQDCKVAMMMADKATVCTRLSFVRGYETLRGNSVLKRGPKKHRTVADRAWPVLGNKLIFEYFRRKATPACSTHTCSAQLPYMHHVAVTTAF